jgi:hypothetical protein
MTFSEILDTLETNKFGGGGGVKTQGLEVRRTQDYQEEVQPVL